MREAGRADSQSYLLRIRGFYGGSPFPRTRVESLTLRKGPRKFKGKGGCACMTPICSPVLVQGLGDAVRPNKPSPEQSSLLPQVQAHSLLLSLSIASFVHTISVCRIQISSVMFLSTKTSPSTHGLKKACHCASAFFSDFAKMKLQAKLPAIARSPEALAACSHPISNN